MKITTRAMRKTDIKKFCAMMKALAAGFGDMAQVTKKMALAYCFGTNKMSSVLLALADKKIVGFAITRDWMNFYLGVKFRHIDFIFIEPDYRQSGAATTLMQAVAGAALRNGCGCLSLDAGADNKSADRLYTKLGFKKRPPISNHYRLENADLIRLASQKVVRQRTA